MCTLRVTRWIGFGACTLLVAAGCATQRAADVPQAAYTGAKLDLGTTLSAGELANYFSYPADGRGLPPGNGSYAQGEKVYQTKCMACHGDKLQGSPQGDRLIGGRGTLVNNSPTKAPVKTIESYWPYATTIFDYVKRAMPFNAPGSLSNDETYAVVAYILGEANVVAKNEVINATTLPKVQMPNRDGFVSPDPRPDVR
jgi:cytochrome c